MIKHSLKWLRLGRKKVLVESQVCQQKSLEKEGANSQASEVMDRNPPKFLQNHRICYSSKGAEFITTEPGNTNPPRRQTGQEESWSKVLFTFVYSIYFCLSDLSFLYL